MCNVIYVFFFDLNNKNVYSHLTVVFIILYFFVNDEVTYMLAFFPVISPN